MQQYEEENEALQDEIEALMRELRIQAQEHGLRQVEAHINTSHQSTIKNVTETDHEIDIIQEFFMNSIVAQQERILEEQGTTRERERAREKDREREKERESETLHHVGNTLISLSLPLTLPPSLLPSESERFEACLDSYDYNIQLYQDSKEAVEFETDQNEQRARRVEAEEQAYASSQLDEELVLQNLAREQEEADRLANNADLVESLTDGKDAMRIVMKAAKEKEQEV